MGHPEAFQRSQQAAAVKRLASAAWRLRNLYWIKNKEGQEVRFKPNWTQEDFLASMWYFNIILKARQLGFTTLITLFILDVCLFNSNIQAGIIADTDEKAMEIFRDKVRFAYEHMPQGFRNARYTVLDSMHTLEFDNGSSIQVGTSMRGTTKQYLLVTELGKIAAESPQKAAEIKTGSFNTVHAGQFLFVESTAKGREGLFFEMVGVAREDQQMKRELTPISFKFHFYPWFLEDSYALSPADAAGVVMTKEDLEYFAKVEAEMECELTREQKAWYVEKRRTQGDDMKAEYPSTPDEAFEVSGEGRILRHEMALVRTQNRILRRLPVIPNLPVNTFWDLGYRDFMAIWFHQRVGPENRLIRYYENAGFGLEKYLIEMRSHNYLLGKFYLPHDAEQKRITGSMQGKSFVDYLHDAGIGANDYHVVERCDNKWIDGIAPLRAFLATCVFDEENCALGIKRLDNYKKTWNRQLGAWRDEPADDDNCHGADALETGARGYHPPATTARPRSGGRRRSYRTV